MEVKWNANAGRSLDLLRFLLARGGRGSRLGLGGLLPIAPDHDDAEEGADDGRAEQDQDDGDADGPDAGREEGVQGVVRVDEGLLMSLLVGSNSIR